MNITIIGAGNIGTYLAAYIGLDKTNKICIHTSKVSKFKEEIELIEEERNLKHKVKLHKITSSIEDAVYDADYILITHPSFMMESTIKEVSKFAKKGAVIGAIPGFGGKEYYIDNLLSKDLIFFGSQRVPSITRLNSYGESVSLKQKNEFMKLSVIPNHHSKRVCADMTNFIDINCLPLTNYLGITLSPSNPTMHPSRLYELFTTYRDGVIYAKNPLFYEEWDNIASSLLLDLDDELTLIFNSLNEFNDFNENDFEKIKLRYNIETADKLTDKIRLAPGFKGIRSPMLKVTDGFIPDLNSRYFTEDIEFGLCILKAFAEILSIETETIDKLINWAQRLLKKDYLINNKLVGSHVKDLIIPQNLGITTKKDLIDYYKNLSL